MPVSLHLWQQGGTGESDGRLCETGTGALVHRFGPVEADLGVGQPVVTALQQQVDALPEGDDVPGIARQDDLQVTREHIALACRLALVYAYVAEVEGLDQTFEAVVGPQAALVCGRGDRYAEGRFVFSVIILHDA